MIWLKKEQKTKKILIQGFKMIIKFFDYEKYQYPLINIEDDGYKEFKEILENYHKEKDYNFDDFIELIKYKKWFVSTITFDVEMYF